MLLDVRFHLLSCRFGLPPERLWISIFEDDDEAFSIWHDEVILVYLNMLFGLYCVSETNCTSV